MKLINGEVFNAKEPLGTLLQMELPVQVSHDLAVMAAKLTDQVKVIEDVRQGLIKKYGIIGEDGRLKTKRDAKGNEMLDLPPDSEAKLNAEINELMGIEVELVIQKVTLPTEVDEKPFKIKPVILMALEKFVGV